MGKPAARVGDMTAHGGAIVAPGAPTVLIGKMPAATLSSMHVCPMFTGPVPHVGGPVILGSTGVFLGKMPAARVGDMAVCVGPPDSIVLGCFTVLIGEAGSGSQAGSAGSAAAAAAAKIIPAKSVSPVPLAPIPPPTDKLHLCDFKLVDSAKKPLTGIPFLLIDPAKIKLKAASHSDGCRYGGYAQAGSYTVEVKQLSNAKWPSDKITVGEEINLTVDADGFEDGEEGVIVLIERTNGAGQNIFGHIPFKVSGKKVKVKWKVDLTHLAPTPVPAPGTAPSTKTFHFLAYGMGAMVVSGPVIIESKLKFRHEDVLGRPMKNRKVQVTFCDGTMREMQLDENGEADFGVVPAGPIRVLLIEEEKAMPADDEAGPYLHTKTVLRKGCRDEEGEKRIKKQGKIQVKGTQVFDLQKDLLDLGFDAVGKADGDFGEGTKGAVKAFQEAAKTGARKQKDKDITVTPGYKGTVNGAVDEATKAEIKEWKAKGYLKKGYSEEFIIFASTVYGESASQSSVAWRAIAHVIMNRVGQREWKKHKTAAAIVQHTGFDAYSQQTSLYVKCKNYLEKGIGAPQKRIDLMVSVIEPVYLGTDADNTDGAQLYYSPKAQTQLHKKFPKNYKSKPTWVNDKVKLVNVKEILETDDFEFYAYK